MIRELWSTFPRLVEENINGLLETAEPSDKKAFMLYKSMKNEDLWRDSFEEFSYRIRDFFAQPKAQRRKSQIDAFLLRPAHQSLYADFHLDFRTAYIPDSAVVDLASWAHHLIRVSKKTTAAFMSLDTMTKTFSYIVNPPPYEKAENIQFEDFCAAWEKIVFRFFGKQYDSEFQEVVKELEWMDAQLKEEESKPRQISTSLTVSMTSIEIDWTKLVLRAATENRRCPIYPRSEGPTKRELIELSRVIQLFEKSLTSKMPELVSQKTNIRATLIDRCERILGAAQGLAS